MANQPSERSFGRRGKRHATDLLGGQTAGRYQSGRRRFHIALDSGYLTGEPEIRSEPQAEGVIEVERCVDEGVAVYHPEPHEPRLRETGKRSKNFLLFTVGQLGLKTN